MKFFKNERILFSFAITRPALAIVGIVVVIAVVTAMIYQSNRPEPLDAIAWKTFNAMKSGDTAILNRYIHPKDRELNNLNSETVNEIYQAIIAPTWTAASKDESNSPQLEMQDRGAVIHQVFRKSSGYLYALSISVERAADGKGYIFFSSSVRFSWVNEEMRTAETEPGDWKIRYRGMMNGLNRNESLLKSLRFQYIVTPNPRKGEIESISLSKLRRMAEAAQRGVFPRSDDFPEDEPA